MSPNLHRNRLREKKKSEPVGSDFCGGDEGDRTPYLLNAIQALSQVSYTPTAPAPISAALFSRVLYYIIKSFLRCQPRIFNFFCEEIKQRAADGKI